MEEQLDLRLDGYLFLLDNAADVERFEADLAHQVAAGIETQVLTPEETQEIVPQLSVGDLRGAVFNPVAGLVSPDLVVQGCARRAARLGAGGAFLRSRANRGRRRPRHRR